MRVWERDYIAPLILVGWGGGGGGGGERTPYSKTLGNNYRSSYLAAVVVGLEEVRYGDLENVGTIEVCAAIISPSGNCSVSFTFFLYFDTIDNSARMYTTHHETRIELTSFLSCFR